MRTAARLCLALHLALACQAQIAQKMEQRLHELAFERDTATGGIKSTHIKTSMGLQLLKIAQARVKKGELEGARMDFDIAIGAFKEAYAATKDNARPDRYVAAGYYARALFWRDTQVWKNATADLGAAMAHLHKDNVLDRAQLLYERGLFTLHSLPREKAKPADYTAAVTDMAGALEVYAERNMTAPQGWRTNYGLSLFGAGKAEEAIAQHTLALQACNSTAERVVILMNRASVYERQRKWPYALQDFGLRLSSDDLANNASRANAHLHRGVAHLQMRNTLGALQDFKDACAGGLEFGCKNYAAVSKHVTKQQKQQQAETEEIVRREESKKKKKDEVR